MNKTDLKTLAAGEIFEILMGKNVLLGDRHQLMLYVQVLKVCFVE